MNNDGNRIFQNPDAYISFVLDILLVYNVQDNNVYLHARNMFLIGSLAC